MRLTFFLSFLPTVQNEQLQRLWISLPSVLNLQVQRHLQLRIEAQGRYLQSVLERAREMLEMDAADSQPSPAADADCLSSDGSCLTENDGPSG